MPPRLLLPGLLLPCLLLLAALMPDLVPATGAPVVSVPQGADAQVQRYLDDAVADGLPGLAVSVTRGGRTIVSAGAGTVEGAPFGASTPTRVESVSKTFTATAVMLLVDDGLVDLDEPVTRYLPELQLADGRQDEITVRHLLTHASGLTDVTSAVDEYEPGRPTLREGVAWLAGARLAATPGTASAYHNGNFVIAARMVEVVDGRPFAQVLEDEILVPLGMDRTTDVATAAAGDVPQGHTFAFGRAVPADGPDFLTDGAGGVVSTTDDLALWLAAQGGHGPDLLSPNSLAETHRRQAPDGYLTALAWSSGPSADGGPHRVSHSGVGPGHSSYAGWFPGDDLGVAVLALHGGALGAPQPYRVAADVRDIVLAGATPVPPGAPSPWPDLLAAGLGAAVVAAAARGAARARRWAARPRRWWSRLARLLPAATVVALPLVVPALQQIATGRTADLVVLWFVSPVLVASVVTAAAACLILLAARVVATRPGAPSPQAP